jgi:hypothetical protein
MRQVRLAVLFRKISESGTANLAMTAATVAVLAGSLWLVQKHETIGGANLQIVPHYSMAVLTSERAHARDPRVGRIGDGFVEAREREISALKQSIAGSEPGSVPIDAKGFPLRPGN